MHLRNAARVLALAATIPLQTLAGQVADYGQVSGGVLPQTSKFVYQPPTCNSPALRAPVISFDVSCALSGLVPGVSPVDGSIGWFDAGVYSIDLHAQADASTEDLTASTHFLGHVGPNAGFNANSGAGALRTLFVDEPTDIASIRVAATFDAQMFSTVPVPGPNFTPSNNLTTTVFGYVLLYPNGFPGSGVSDFFISQTSGIVGASILLPWNPGANGMFSYFLASAAQIDGTEARGIAYDLEADVSIQHLGTTITFFDQSGNDVTARHHTSSDPFPDVPVTTAPEPSMLALLTPGALAVAMGTRLRRRKRKMA